MSILPAFAFDNVNMFKENPSITLAASDSGYKIGTFDTFLYISSKLFTQFNPSTTAIIISSKPFLEGIKLFEDYIEIRFTESELTLSDEKAMIKIPTLVWEGQNFLSYWDPSQVILDTIIQPSSLLKSIFLVPILNGVVELKIEKSLSFQVISSMGARISSSLSNLEKFRFQYPKESLSLRYMYKKFANLKYTLKKASKITLRLNEDGVLQWQMLLPIKEQNVYVEYFIEPLIEDA
eukprot:NODE_1_length_95616_cov_0.657642.p44 type:complete len:236 gc:universal NODE_1_length_95616_cov_0.657642:84668-83961(-)